MRGHRRRHLGIVAYDAPAEVGGDRTRSYDVRGDPARPYAPSPTYSGTKAAIHSYTASLRALLSGAVEIIEIVPPQVTTDLTPALRDSPYSVPLDAFADEVLALLEAPPSSGEILVESVKPFRFAERDGTTDEMIAGMLAN